MGKSSVLIVIYVSPLVHRFRRLRDKMTMGNKLLFLAFFEIEEAEKA